MTTIQYYSLNDYNEILLSYAENVTYKLDSTVLDIIGKLSKELGVSISTNITSTHTNEKRVRKNKESAMEKTWHQSSPQFKATVLEKKEGTTMGDIRAHLNKMSAKNYDSSKDSIFDLIRSKNGDEDALIQIANNIFDIASTNKFYSEMYANLYKALISEFGIFEEILQNFLEKYTETMRDIKYVDPNSNYDDFCAYNKKNDMRKATTVFIVNLTKNGSVDKTILLNIFEKIMAIFYELVEKEGHVNEVDEITENIALFVSNAKAVLNGSEQYANAAKVAKWKSKEKASLSSRAVFKFMDMFDK